MSDRPMLQPTAEHPITVESTGQHVTVRVGGDVVAETRNALTLRESSYPDVQYIPLQDVADQRLKPSDTTTYCPFKGDASYFHVRTTAGDTVEDAVWIYAQPYPAVAAIADHVAFYPDRADVTLEA